MKFKSLAQAAFQGAGGLSVARYLKHRAVRILMYHRFPPGDAASLEKQCAHLKKHYNLVSLSDVAQWLESGDLLPSNSLAVTVDDGYQDSFAVAFPVFRAYRIPATVFLTTDFVDGKAWLWGDRVKHALVNTTRSHVEVAGLQLDLGSVERRIDAAFRVKEQLKRIPDRERLKLVADLPRLVEVSLPAHPPEEYAPLTWAEVRQMAASGIDFGAHTRTHPILSRVTEKNELCNEIEGAKVRIEEELRRPVFHFCYPNGHLGDFSPETVGLVRDAGFKTAVTAEPGVVHTGANPFLLNRIGMEPHLAERLFGLRAAGWRIR